MEEIGLFPMPAVLWSKELVSVSKGRREIGRVGTEVLTTRKVITESHQLPKKDTVCQLRALWKTR